MPTEPSRSLAWPTFDSTSRPPFSLRVAVVEWQSLSFGPTPTLTARTLASSLPPTEPFSPTVAESPVPLPTGVPERRLAVEDLARLVPALRHADAEDLQLLPRGVDRVALVGGLQRVDVGLQLALSSRLWVCS